MSQNDLQITWSVGQDVTSEADLVVEPFSFTISTSGDLGSRLLAFNVLYLSNEGPEDPSLDPRAYRAGFYLSDYASERGSGLETLLRWSTLRDVNERSYGAFTVFGYDDDSGASSYVDQFIGDSIDPAVLDTFKHTYMQGDSPSYPLPLDVSYRYINGEYVKSKNFEKFDSSLAANGNGERSGKLKVCFGFRVPDTAEARKLLVKHSFYYERPL